MNQVLPDIKPAGIKGFTKFLTKQYTCDLLFPVYGKSSVSTIFQSWQGELMNHWCRFTNENGDILEFFPEGQYVLKPRNESNNSFQLRTPKTIKEFIDDMKKFGVQLFWSDWVVKKFNTG